MNRQGRYVPAAGYRLLTGLYDPIVAVTTRERVFRRRLIELADAAGGHTILDLACGTGTLAVWIKQRMPGVRVVGVDADPGILVRAKRKARSHGVEVAFNRGFATKLPYERHSFEHAFSSLFFHHLSRDDKLTTIREVARVLKPGGGFYVADWGRPRNALMHALFSLVRLLDGYENTRDNVKGRLSELFAEGGFVNVEVKDELSTMWGTLVLHVMRKPEVPDEERAA